MLQWREIQLDKSVKLHIEKTYTVTKNRIVRAKTVQLHVYASKAVNRTRPFTMKETKAALSLMRAAYQSDNEAHMTKRGNAHFNFSNISKSNKMAARCRRRKALRGRDGSKIEFGATMVTPASERVCASAGV